MEIGMVTSKGSEISVTDNRLDLFNTDIVDNENSDGVIINMRGEVIGLITRTLKEGINEEINTAIGISKLKLLIERMVNQEPILYCGIITEELTEEAKADHQVDSGIFVNEVIANSPAFDCGIKNGDIILQIDDATVLNSNNFYNIISSYQPEDKIKIKILRTSKTTEKEIELEITLVEKEK
jgi:S1-C subfamily serine protease